MLCDTATAYSCVTWLSTPDTLIEIKSGETREVAVGVKVPFAAQGGGYGAVVFEMLPAEPGGPRGEAGSAGAEYRFQLPAWLEITVKTGRIARGRLEARRIRITPTAQDPALTKQYGERGMVVSAEVENTGNIRVVTNGRLIIRDEKGRLVRSTQLGGGRGSVLPVTRTRLETITKLPDPGTYSIKAIVDYGGRAPAIAQTSFEIASARKTQAGKSEVALPLYVDVRPDRFETSIPAGGFRALGLSLMNQEDAPVAVDVVLGQFTYDENGQLWVSEEDADSGRSCAGWLSIEPRHLVLEPRRPVNVRVTLRIPSDATGGYYSCVVLNARRAADTASPTLPSPIYCPILLSVPPKLVRAGEVVKIDVEQPGPSAVTLTTEFRNRGNVHAVIAGGINLQRWVVPKTVAGLEVVDTARFENVAALFLETDSTFVLPGGTRVVSSQTAKGFPPGRYRAQVAIRYGGESPATLEREFVIRGPEQEE
jgi:hypothetical protein